MAKRATFFDFAFIDTQPVRPLHRWLSEQVRAAVLDGRLQPGTRLPSSRAFAQQYGLARGTVVDVFAQLVAEGYIHSKVGAGTYVLPALPDHLLKAAPSRAVLPAPCPRARQATLSQRGAALVHPPFPRSRPQEAGLLFDPYQPALEAFPARLWAQIASRRLRRIPPGLLGHGNPCGYLPLRHNLAAYLGATRGVHASAEQIVVVGSVQQALELTARLLCDADEAVWLEDPGYPGARAILHAAGVRVLPVPVDAEGLQVATGQRLCSEARLAYVTPAHQAPLGVCLSLARRIALLDWAQRVGAWIFEDDYDGDFRYKGRPVAALQALDQQERVIYAGSFSKTLFPALRIAYMVLPAGLVDAFAAARSVTARYAPLLDQMILADFIAEGHYARHLRRMLHLYAERRAALLQAVAEASSPICVAGDEAGLNTVAWLAPGRTEREAVAAATSCGVFVQPLGPYTLQRPLPPGLVLGFAAGTPAAIRHAVQRFSEALAREGASTKRAQC